MDKSESFDQIKSKFDILLFSLGYSFDEKKSFKSKDSNSLVVYINKAAQKRLEFSGDLNWFHLEIRRLKSDKPYPYENEKNNIGFEYFLKQKGSLNFFVGSKGWMNVLDNTKKMIKENREFFINSEWLIFENKDTTFKTELFTIEKLRNLLVEVYRSNLKERRFKIRHDSFRSGPHLQEWTFLFELQRKNDIIKFRQYDWRDYANIITISVNDREVRVIDLSEYKDSDRESLKKKINKLIINHSA